MTLILLFLFPITLKGHPTSFEGAWSIVSETMGEAQHHSLSYSHRYWLAPAIHYIRLPVEREGQTLEMGMIGVNTLLKRWNHPTSQGNLYLSGAFGRERHKELKTRPVGNLQIDLDWEDRRYYVATAYSHYFRKNHEDPNFLPIKDIRQYKLRGGFAPYLGEFTELNTWFIVQLSQTQNEKIETTPLLRFYYRNALWEIGSSLRGGFLFNFMLHL